MQVSPQIAMTLVLTSVTVLLMVPLVKCYQLVRCQQRCLGIAASTHDFTVGNSNQVSFFSKRKVAGNQASALVSESCRKVGCRIENCSKDYS